MKKVLVSIVLIGLLTVPTITSAAWYDWILGGGGSREKPPGLTTAPPTDVMVVLDNITDWLFAILLIIASIAIIIAGYFFVTATGDPEKTKTARNFVLYALIGVLVGVCAKGLVALVRRIAG